MVPAEILFTPGLSGFAFGFGGDFVEDFRYRSGILGELVEEVRGDGQEVATAEGLDLAAITEGGTHDFGLDAVPLVIGKDPADGLHAGVIGTGGGGFVPIGTLRLLVPIVDATHERRDELDLGIGTGGGLREGEEQGQVAADAFFFEFSGSLDAFPGRSHLHENAFLGDAGCLIESDELAGLGDCGGLIERQAGIDFGRDAAGDNLEDFRAEGDEEGIDGGLHALALVILGRLLEEGLVFGHLDGLKNKARVGRGIQRLESLHGGEVAGIGDDLGVLAKLFECVHERR